MSVITSGKQLYFCSSRSVTVVLYNIHMSLRTSCELYGEIPKNLKGRSKSSQDWLTRQLKDPYVEKAKMKNYRCRSAFKLLEMDDKFHFLYPGQRVIDCGAAPGSWTQVLVEKTNSLGKIRSQSVGHVIGIDRISIYPIEGAVLLNKMDFTSKEAQDKIQEKLEGHKVDVVLSDMAPNATGVQFLDHENIIHLAYTVLRFSVQYSVLKGTMLIKIWDGQDSQNLEKDIKRFYRNVKYVKTNASRAESSEKYILAREFRGLSS